MKVRIVLIIGGALLLVYGGVFCVNNLDVVKIVDSAGALILFSAGGLFKAAMIVFPLALAFAGLLGLAAGLLNRNSILSWANFIGLRVAVLSALLLASVVICSPAALAPYYRPLAAKLGITADINQLYIVSAIALAACVQIYQTGVNIAEYGALDAFIITRTVSRALFILGFLPAFYLFGLPETITKVLPFTVPENRMPALVFAALCGYFIWIFVMIRSKMSNNSSVKISLLTLLCVPAFVAYYALIQAVYGIGIIRTILGWTFLIPLAAIVFLMRPLGYAIRRDAKRIGYSVCEWCRNEFEGIYRFCNTECQEIAEKPVIVQCSTCGKPITTTNLHYRNGTYPSYCSYACTPRTVYKCGKCGREISGRYTTCSYCGTYNN